MSKQTKDLVAAAHQAFATDEISLKQLAIAKSELKREFRGGHWLRCCGWTPQQLRAVAWATQTGF